MLVLDESGQQDLRQGKLETIVLSIEDDDGDPYDLSSGYSGAAVVSCGAGHGAELELDDDAFTFHDGTGSDGRNVEVELTTAQTAALRESSVGMLGETKMAIDIDVIRDVDGEVVHKVRIPILLIHEL